MEIAIHIIIALVILLHFYFLYLEMFAWTTKGPKVFRGLFPKELFEKTKAMAANQGLSNGFLATGLLWTFLLKNSYWQSNIRVFFLACVIIAGIYGGLTVSKKILFVQAVPALIGVIILFFDKL